MIATEGLEEKLSQILNDPNSMAQILSMAQSFGLSPETPPQTEPEPDNSFLPGLLQLMQTARRSDGKQETLLLAIKPYLVPERQAKIDRAMEIARIAHLAGFALRNYGGLLGKKGG